MPLRHGFGRFQHRSKLLAVDFKRTLSTSTPSTPGVIVEAGGNARSQFLDLRSLAVGQIFWRYALLQSLHGETVGAVVEDRAAQW